MEPGEAPEPVLTPRLRLGFGLLAFGIGLMFFSGKTLPQPLPSGIAGGIALGIVGFVMVIVEALREPPEGSSQSR
jgi:CRISPR-associated Cas5-like protein